VPTDAPWQYSITHSCVCKVVEEQVLWGQELCLIWLPNQDVAVRVPKGDLKPLDQELRPEVEAGRIVYLAAAAKVAEAMEGSRQSSDGPLLLAPMESKVIPLPHQINALSRAVSGDRIRYLLADEVGLGKTIEAGLILKELKLRGLARRILIVSPVSLITQWQLELKTHFNEHFTALYPGSFAPYHYCYPDRNVWTFENQFICPMDAVKPLDSRKGWDSDQLDDHNRWRFLDLITSGWDLIIVDEAHRLAGASSEVARYKLGQGLAAASPYLLLLSATPHQGKSDSFHRLMNFLDDLAFPDGDSISREAVAPYIIRTEKRKAIDSAAKPLFKPRRTQMIAVKWAERHSLQRRLYHEVTAYVRHGYNQALRENKRHVAFLLILMQRLVVSSTRAIRGTLEKRLTAIESGRTETGQRLKDLSVFDDSPETLFDLDTQTFLDEILKIRLAALDNEKEEVERLLLLARQCEGSELDAKAEEILDRIYQLQSEENDPEIKILVFTEFTATQAMLRDFFADRGFSVAVLNGSMTMDERQQAQDSFRTGSRVLISTDAGGEGLNLQFCHVVVNYDLPWNPMRLEQRIGRVDRIGQDKTVRALNFVFEDSIEFRVRDILEQKLAIIYDEFGIDKTGDVLDTAQAGELFDEAFAAAIVNPDEIETSLEQAVEKVRRELQDTRQNSPVFGLSEEPDATAAEMARSHPWPHWLERMTIGYLQSHNGQAVRKKDAWDITWPDGQSDKHCVFTVTEPETSSSNRLSLEDSHILGLTCNLPQIVSGQPLPTVKMKALPKTVSGLWGLYEVRIKAWFQSQGDPQVKIPPIRRGYFCVFKDNDGRLFLPTAHHIWDTLQNSEIEITGSFADDESASAFNSLENSAFEAGREIYNTIYAAHLAALTREEERGEISFRSRRKAVDRIGLPTVRNFRRHKIQLEEDSWRKELAACRQVLPELRPLILMSVSGDDQ